MEGTNGARLAEHASRPMTTHNYCGFNALGRGQSCSREVTKLQQIAKNLF